MPKATPKPQQPEAPRKRGRPALGKEAMTAAERKRRSRSLQRQAGFLAAGQTGLKRIPRSFACDLDELAIAKLRRVAKERKATLYEVLEQLINDHL